MLIPDLFSLISTFSILFNPTARKLQEELNEFYSKNPRPKSPVVHKTQDWLVVTDGETVLIRPYGEEKIYHFTYNPRSKKFEFYTTHHLGKVVQLVDKNPAARALLGYEDQFLSEEDFEELLNYLV